MKKLHLLLVLGIAFNGPMACAEPIFWGVKKGQDQEKTQLASGRISGAVAKIILKDVSLAYGSMWTCLIAHEMGHAGAAKALGMKVHSINVGGSHTDRSYLSMRNTFFIRGFMPFSGACFIGEMSNPLKNIAIYAAGPAAGTAAAILLAKLGGGTVIYPCAIVSIATNLAQLNPLIVGSDGQGMMQELKKIIKRR